MDCSTPGFPVLCFLLEFAQAHVHGVSDAIQPSHPLSLPSPPAINEAYQLLNKRGIDTPYSPGSYKGLFGNVIHNFYQVKLSLVSMA